MCSWSLTDRQHHVNSQYWKTVEKSLQLIHRKEYFFLKLGKTEKNVVGNMLTIFKTSSGINYLYAPRVLYFSSCVTNWDSVIGAFNSEIKYLWVGKLKQMGATRG